MPSEYQAHNSSDQATDFSTSVTCPQCMTRFRLKAQQLELAKGLVRCSVCMSIFNGAPPVAPGATQDRLAQNDFETSAEVDDAEPTSSESTDSPLDLIAGLSTVNHDFEHHYRRQQPRRWPWLIMNFIALVVLAGQIALWQKAALFASPAGAYLRQLCPAHPLLCETKAPEARVLGDVVSTHLLIRKHPSVANALIVDAILLNRGASPTSFPALQLHFSDINDQTLANRVFQPSEYLAGELNALSTLPSQQPVHIALEIVDPGSAAINYQLQLLP